MKFTSSARRHPLKCVKRGEAAVRQGPRSSLLMANLKAALARHGLDRRDRNAICLALATAESSGVRRGELSDLAAFIAVADNLSFRAAAVRLGVTPSALSHTVRQLEERVGVRLLHRTTRSVSPTDAGRRLLERLRPAIEQIAGALDDLNGERARPFGRLRIYATHLAGATVLAPVWSRFLSTYPDVHLELRLDDASTDIVAGGYDAGIGPKELAAADMVAVRVMAPMQVAVVGAPGYFARRPPPRLPDDLAEHECIRFRRGSDGAVFDWAFERGGRSRRG